MSVEPSFWERARLLGLPERKPTGRPRKAQGERRDDRLPNVRVTTAERQHVEAQAAQAGLPLVEYCRRSILARRIPAKASDADERLILELNRVGVNLNQIARAVNADCYLTRDFPQVLTELRAILERLAVDDS